MGLIGDGIRCDQPPQDDCCRKHAHNFIITFGREQWLCGGCCDQHLSVKGVLHCEGEDQDAKSVLPWNLDIDWEPPRHREGQQKPRSSLSGSSGSFGRYNPWSPCKIAMAKFVPHQQVGRATFRS